MTDVDGGSLRVDRSTFCVTLGTSEREPQLDEQYEALQNTRTDILSDKNKQKNNNSDGLKKKSPNASAPGKKKRLSNPRD